MKAFLLVVLFASAALALEFAPMAKLYAPKATKALPILKEEHYATLFNKWGEKFNRTYDDEEELDERYLNFKANLDFAREWNHNHRGEATMAINQFGDWSVEEYREKMLGYRPSATTIKRHGGVHVVANASAPLPASVDWRTKGVVSHIKNQGQCGSCWSFSATGSMEGQHALKTGKLVSLSEENLMDCSTAEGNQGCNGGLMDQAFEYVISNGGIDTEASYPYIAEQDPSCEYNAANSGATISSYNDIQSGSEKDLQQAVATVGPVSVAIDANHQSFMQYSSGVLTIYDCSSTQLDHGVLAVGYGNQGGQDYWIVKNSWGTSWGMSGYVFMRRNYNNMCGIATAASYPIV